MSKKKMTLKEFAERYECCYSAAGVRLKKLIAKDKKFAKHVSRKGRTYLLDEYAAELLKPKSTKRASVSSSDIEKLKKKMLKAAENLEFEEAAKIRDEIKKISPDCKVVLVVDENSDREEAERVRQAKKEGVIDQFIYGSTSANYMVALMDTL